MFKRNIILWASCTWLSVTHNVFFFFFFSLLTVQQVLSVVLYEISSRINMFCISIMTNIYLQIYISHSNVYKKFMKPRIG